MSRSVPGDQRDTNTIAPLINVSLPAMYVGDCCMSPCVAVGPMILRPSGLSSGVCVVGGSWVLSSVPGY
ncbi:hypothetical protein GDO81_029498 [Engystomops pustulosus]|uniref:Uncharacterized protein n=1 Tax=Engystomops pustulosus TaxID=76066 RepID=A0AAV6YV74_ENGPU|nr:hypothetical protein GDO81_029498 [Engystomops pustulosus]